jgi:hypothetical protein
VLTPYLLRGKRAYATRHLGHRPGAAMTTAGSAGVLAGRRADETLASRAKRSSSPARAYECIRGVALAGLERLRREKRTSDRGWCLPAERPAPSNAGGSGCRPRCRAYRLEVCFGREGSVPSSVGRYRPHLSELFAWAYGGEPSCFQVRLLFRLKRQETPFTRTRPVTGVHEGVGRYDDHARFAANVGGALRRPGIAGLAVNWARLGGTLRKEALLSAPPHPDEPGERD